MNIGENSIEAKPVQEDYWEIRVNGVEFGVWETSQIRHLIGFLDDLVH